MTEAISELMHIVEGLPDDKVEQIAAYAKVVAAKPARRPKTEPFAWMSSGAATNGRTDNATHVDEILAQGFGRRAQ